MKKSGIGGREEKEGRDGGREGGRRKKEFAGFAFGRARNGGREGGRDRR